MSSPTHPPGAEENFSGTLLIMVLLILMIVALWIYSYYVVVARG